MLVQLPTKVAMSESMKRIAYFLRDHADMLVDIGPIGDDKLDKENDAMVKEMRELAELADGLCAEWERRISIVAPEDAAKVIAGMLRDWSFAGVVWYKSSTNRFRLTREDYAAEDGEECVGLYLPGVDESALADDFRELMPHVPAESRP